MVLREVEKFFAGGRPQFLVNPSVLGKSQQDL
jgi:hypothetical protein